MSKKENTTELLTCTDSSSDQNTHSHQTRPELRKKNNGLKRQRLLW